MYLRLKENCTFTDINTGISKTATSEDYPILKSFNLSLRTDTEEVNFYGEFYLSIFWNINTVSPFYTQQVQLSPEIINQYKIISIPEGITEVDISVILQQIIYQFLINTPEFTDWELIN